MHTEGCVYIQGAFIVLQRLFIMLKLGIASTSFLQRVHNVTDRPGVRFKCGAVSGEGACRREAKTGWSGLDLQCLGREKRRLVQLMGQRSEGVEWLL